MGIEWPEAYADMFRACFGAEQWRLYCEAFLSPPVRGVRANPHKAGGAAVHALQAAGLLLDPVPWSADSYYIPVHAPVGADPLHAAGCLYLQEPSAMAAAAALSPDPGERILDLCAAPGSKTTHIAALMNNDGWLVANEPNPERCRILAENTERMGLTSTTVTQAKPESLSPLFPQFFSAILVDAPCSGEGMFRKDADARACWRPDLPLANARRQLDILEAAYSMLAPGGRILYATCTFNPVENEGVVLNFLARHPELALAQIHSPQSAPGLTVKELQTIRTSYRPLDHCLRPIDDWLASREICDTSLCARYFPHQARGEGHFMAVLYRQRGLLPEDHAASDNDNTRRERARRRTTTVRGAHSPLAALFREFAARTLSESFLHHLEDTYTLWPQGDLLFAAPRDLANHLRTAIAPAKQRPPDSRRRTSARLQS
ncbi:MAG: RsmB/NOP family class I SAM-dependent RNA methyltransferase, partial [Bacilli bacterium]